MCSRVETYSHAHAQATKAALRQAKEEQKQPEPTETPATAPVERKGPAAAAPVGAAGESSEELDSDEELERIIAMKQKLARAKMQKVQGPARPRGRVRARTGAAGGKGAADLF